MGSGKTTALMNMVKADSAYYNAVSSKRFIFVSPYIDEVEHRISVEISCKYPIGKKYEHIKELIGNGENIACCHALFNMFDKEIFELIGNCGYVYDLIIDEQPAFIRNIVGAIKQWSSDEDKQSRIEVFTNADIRLIQENQLIKLDIDTQRVTWNNDHWYNLDLEKREGVFSSFKFCADTSDLYSIKNSDSNRINTIIALTKKEVFELFNDVWISSYMTKESFVDYYCQLYDIDTNYYHIDNRNIVKGYKFDYPKGLDRLCICQNEKYNVDFALTKNWYRNEQQKHKQINNGDTVYFKKLAECFHNFLRNECKSTKANSYYWTTFKSNQQDIPKKYINSKSFIECNKKATNDKQDCLAVGYLCNRHINPNIANFFAGKGITFNNNQYALSELLQFIYRSNLRVEDSDKKVHVFVPSERMRNLLAEFIKQANNLA